MRVFFLSDQPRALFVNGEFSGIVDGAPKFLDLFPAERPFLEFLPPSPASPTRFFLEEAVDGFPPQLNVFQADGFWALSFASNQTDNRVLSNPCPEELVLFQLFRRLLAKESVDDLLAKNLQPKSASLLDFLGEFTAAFPLNDPNTVGVVLPTEQKNVFSLRFYRAEMQDGRIKNVIRTE